MHHERKLKTNRLMCEVRSINIRLGHNEFVFEEYSLRKETGIRMKKLGCNQTYILVLFH
jgi:hypothetical protein